MKNDKEIPVWEKVLDTLRWKFGHCRCKKSVEIRISWNEYIQLKEEIKKFQEKGEEGG